MDIFANPLTLNKVSRHIETCLVAYGPSGYQIGLHAALRNCIDGNNVAMMQEILSGFRGVDLNLSFDSKPLLHYAAAYPRLAQGPEALAPLAFLLDHGGDAAKVQRFCVFADDARLGRPAFHGNLPDYLNYALALTKEPVGTAALYPDTTRTIETINYAKGLIATRLPELALDRAVTLLPHAPVNTASAGMREGIAVRTTSLSAAERPERAGKPGFSVYTIQ